MSETTQANFRMPKELKDIIEKSAKDNGRSITQEFITALESTYALQEKPKRNIIFTEYNPSSSFDDYSPSNNEAVRMDCAKFMSSFFADHPNYEFMQLESKVITNKKGQEILIGVRIWYRYTA